jgi:hypothetical protein
VREGRGEERRGEEEKRKAKKQPTNNNQQEEGQGYENLPPHACILSLLPVLVRSPDQ